MDPPPADDRFEAFANAFGRLPAIHRKLDASKTVGELFARAAEHARTECGFSRGLVLSIRDGRLTAAESDALPDPASDALRRRVLAQPVPLQAGTEEVEIVRRASGAGRRRKGAEASVLARTLNLAHYVLAPVAPQSQALALLVADRPGPPVDALDRVAVTGLAGIVAVSLERVLLRARVHELSAELRYLSSSAQALMAEVLEAPLSLPAGGRRGPVFPRVEGAMPPMADDRLRELFSDREREILALLVEGRSNREIAEQLILSPETVKAHVARILRKLNASNRVEAVARYLRLARGMG